jgi:carbamoyltransferase
MELAPYGEPRYLPEMRQIVRLHSNGHFELDLRYFRHHREQIAYLWSDGPPVTAELFTPDLEALLGPRRDPSVQLDQRHRDMARSVQNMYEEAFFNLLKAVHEIAGDPNIALAGGCAMNSVANGKIRRQTAFREVYVQAAAGDAGGAIGAAFAVWHQLGGSRGFVMNHAFWGPQFSATEIGELMRSADWSFRHNSAA